MNWSLITACNSNSVLESCLAASPCLSRARDFQVMRGFASAGAAYNSGIQQSKGDIMVFAHQDVYLPPGWDDHLASAVSFLSDREPTWAVLGVFGITSENKPRGHVYCTGLRRVLGGPFPEPVECGSLDELVLIVRRSAGLNFDEQLPGYHFYGTDICLEARRRGLKSFIIPAFCVHNTEGLRFLPRAYWHAYFYMRRKWWNSLPIKTPCSVLRKLPVPVLEHPVRSFYSHCVKGKQPGKRVADPANLFERIRSQVQPSPNSHVLQSGSISHISRQ
jgi:hypothetical protein